MEILGCMDVSVTWILVAGVLFLFYLCGKRRNRVFKDMGVKGPEPLPFIGNLHQALVEGVKFESQYGPVSGVYLGGLPVLNVEDPDMNREILIKQFSKFSDRYLLDLDDYPVDVGLFFQKGQVWKRLRRIMSPTFSGSKLRLMSEKIVLCSKILTDELLAAASKKSEIFVKDYFGAFTMDVIASTAFGIDTQSQGRLDNRLLVEAQKVFGDAQGIFSISTVLTLIFPEITPLFKKLGFSQFPRKSVSYLGEAVSQMIKQRKEDSKSAKKVDFLQLLLDAEDDGETDDVAAEGTDNSKCMTREEVLGQALLFFVAGYETTASTLNFVAYLLATNPEVQERVYEELESVLGDKSANYDNIRDLVYLDHVITETLRLYPVVVVLSRKPCENVTVGDYTIPKGMAITIPTFKIHRNPKVYPDPHKFLPDRWDRKSEIDPMNYLPFGHGPRNCIGMRLAQVEMKVGLATALRKIRFLPGENTPMTLEEKDLQIGASFKTKKPIKLRVEAR